MHTGVCMFNTDYAIRIEELARAAEERGFESLFVPEHKTRFKRLAEQVLAMKQIWTKDAAEFHGKFVSFDPIWMWPKPVQRPHPPILLGGESGYTLQRVVDFCDGWFPRGRAGDAILAGRADLNLRAGRARRDIKTISVSVFGAKPENAALDR